MKAMILGADGYIGWPLSMKMANAYGEVVVVDNYATRRLVADVGGISAMPIGADLKERAQRFEKHYPGKKMHVIEGDLKHPAFVEALIRKYKPETIIHLAQQRSAPYSQISTTHALYTQVNNVSSNLNLLFAMHKYAPKAHLLKMGSMGEYGTPNIAIEEGFMDIEYKGRKDKITVPRMGGSWYHQSKIFDSYNVAFANRVWGLRATDVMQGVVYGNRTAEMIDEGLLTRLDIDSIWGTVINKYCAQLIALKKLLIYGKGLMTRGFLSLEDSISALFLLTENPPAEGEYRIVNQLDRTYNTYELAEKVKKIGEELGFESTFETVENPRVEKQEHYYEVVHEKLPSVGFKPKHSVDGQIREIIKDLDRYRSVWIRKKSLLMPNVYWNRSENSEASKKEAWLYRYITKGFTGKPPELGAEGSPG